jgi:hypothetical protein
MPYFPPPRAEELLDRARSLRNLCRVPALGEHFLSLAYHAVYHKGYGSGLLSSIAHRAPRRTSDHDYQGVLAELASRLAIDVSLTLEDLDEYLALQGWRPSSEVLSRLALHNDWLRSRLAATDAGLVAADAAAASHSGTTRRTSTTAQV